jgi:transposase-like protein
MLSTTVVHTCRYCGSEHLRKNGHTVRGAQRAKCLDCQRTLVLDPKGPRYGPAFKEQVLAAYQDRMSLRGIKRTFGVCYQTVMVWLGEKSGEPPRVQRHAATQPRRRRVGTR